MLHLVGISYKLEESATSTISIVIITLHNKGDAMCSHGNLASTARSALGAPPSLQTILILWCLYESKQSLKSVMTERDMRVECFRSQNYSEEHLD